MRPRSQATARPRWRWWRRERRQRRQRPPSHCVQLALVLVTGLGFGPKVFGSSERGTEVGRSQGHGGWPQVTGDGRVFSLTFQGKRTSLKASVTFPPPLPPSGRRGERRPCKFMSTHNLLNEFLATIMLSTPGSVHRKACFSFSV